MDIGNIHTMRHSLKELGDFCHQSQGFDFFNGLHKSGWLYHVSKVRCPASPLLPRLAAL
jgi:hypothetical protein